MAKSLWKDNINAKEILLTLAKIGAFTVASTSPYFFHKVIKYYFREQSYKRRLAKQRMLRELEKKKYISFEEQADGTIKITLTHKGKIFVRQYNLENFKLQKPKKWDKCWRVLLYDIPVQHKRASDVFREKLKQLGLYQLQKSVWVSPYDFISEIEFLCGVFNIDINRYILYFTTSHIPKESILKSFFALIKLIEF